MEKRLDRIMTHIFMRPLLIELEAGELIARVIANRVAAGKITTLDELEQEVSETDAGAQFQLNRFYGTTKRATRDYGLSRMYGSTGIVTINGELVNRGAWIGSSSGLVSYEGLAVQLKDVANDPEITNVIVDMNTPGGEAAGIEGAADALKQLNSVKPVTAFVNSRMLSGGMWLGSQCKDIVVSQSSAVGSVGVVVYHLDRSKQFKKEGVKVTAYQAGKHKTDFSPLGPLSKEASDRLDADIKKIHGRFVGAVAQGRGTRMSADAVRETEAMIYDGEDAVKIGFADRVMSFDDLLQELKVRPPARSQSSGALASAGKSGVRTESGSKQKAATMATETGDKTEAQAAADDATRQANANALSIMKLCAAAGFPALAAGFIESHASVKDVETRLTECKEIKDAVTSACSVNSAVDPAMADRFINSGASLAHVQGQLLKALKDAGPVIRGAHQGGSGSAQKGAPETPAQISESWKAALTKVGAFKMDRPAAKRTKMRA